MCDFSLLISKGLIDPFVTVTVLLYLKNIQYSICTVYVLFCSLQIVCAHTAVVLCHCRVLLDD
jgi:hypothetical protein